MLRRTADIVSVFVGTTISSEPLAGTVDSQSQHHDPDQESEVIQVREDLHLCRIQEKETRLSNPDRDSQAG